MSSGVKEIRLKSAKLILLLLSIALLINSSAFKPDGNSIVMIVNPDTDVDRVTPGTVINVTYVLKNFTNDTMRDINITLDVPTNLDVVATPFGNPSEEEISFDQPREYMGPFGDNLTIIRGYANSSFYNFSVPDLHPDDVYVWQISYNSSTQETFNLSPPEIKYIDHFGDVNTFEGGNQLSINYRELSNVEGGEELYPRFDTAEVNWWLVIGIMFAVAVVAFLSRLLHGKLPF